MKTNKTRIAFKIIRLIRKLNPDDWATIKYVVDNIFYALRTLEKEDTQPSDDIEEIEEELKEDK